MTYGPAIGDARLVWIHFPLTCKTAVLTPARLRELFSVGFKYFSCLPSILTRGNDVQLIWGRRVHQKTRSAKSNGRAPIPSGSFIVIYEGESAWVDAYGTCYPIVGYQQHITTKSEVSFILPPSCCMRSVPIHMELDSFGNMSLCDFHAREIASTSWYMMGKRSVPPKVEASLPKPYRNSIPYLWNSSFHDPAIVSPFLVISMQRPNAKSKRIFVSNITVVLKCGRFTQNARKGPEAIFQL